MLFNCIQKIIKLESSLGNKIPDKILDPFPLHTNDVIGIENAGKIIADYIGLEKYNFVIDFKENTDYAGKIHVSDESKDIRVEISKEILDFPEVVLATLSHEITHKFLFVNQIYYENNYENELVTDIATLLLGFGKLMLNGIDVVKINQLNTFYFSSTLKDEVKIGYLSEEYFAFLYILINHLKNIPKKSYYFGLSKSAKDIISSCLTKYQKELDVENLSKRASNYSQFRKELHLLLSREKKELIYLKQTIEKLNSELYLKTHKQMADIDLEENMIANTNNPKLAKMYQFKANLKKYFLKEDFKEISLIFNDLEKIYKLVQLKIDLMKNSPKFFDYINCPNCMTKLRLKENRQYTLIKCPKCNYQFGVDTTKDILKIKANLNKLRKLANS